MKTIIAGSRNVSYVDWVQHFKMCPWRFEISKVLCGTARGPDSYGEAWAERRGVPVDRYLPNWETYGRSAGPLRNTLMVGHADALILIWDGKSRGSCDVLKKAEMKRLLIYESCVGDIEFFEKREGSF